MQKVIIENLGPIQEAEIILKPFVVIIGKSGSGKSIILRTISLLKWLCKHGWTESFHEQTLFKAISKKELVEYLKESMLDTYIHKNTKIQLIEDDVPIIEIKNKNNVPTIETSPYLTKNKKLIGKIIFINDIRNFLPELFTLPQQRKIKLSYHTDDMIENFIESVENSNNFQLNTMKNITFKSEIKVGFSKYYLEHNGIKIPFEQSSSGEKSTSILEIICNYFAYSYNIKKTSIKKIAIKNALHKVIMSKNALDKQYSNIEKTVLEQIELLDFIFSKKYQLSLDIFIEEPESNLFPINQKNMAYYLSSLRNATNNPNIMFSTHSPYILTALNNILYASIIKAKLRNDEQNNIYKIINKENIFNHKDFIAYKLENGKSYSIIDKATMLIDAEYIDTASSEIMDDFYKIAELDK